MLLINCPVCARTEKKDEIYCGMIRIVKERGYDCICGHKIQINIAYIKKNCIIDDRAKLK
jgi:uncharacterized protein (DUF2225 family)